MKQIHLIYTLYDNIYQLFNDIVQSPKDLKLVAYYPVNSDNAWISDDDYKYNLFYSLNDSGNKIVFKCAVADDGTIEKQMIESFEKLS